LIRLIILYIKVLIHSLQKFTRYILHFVIQYFVNSYLKEYLIKRSFINVLKNSQDQLQEYAIKNGDFRLKKISVTLT